LPLALPHAANSPQGLQTFLTRHSRVMVMSGETHICTWSCRFHSHLLSPLEPGMPEMCNGLQGNGAWVHQSTGSRDDPLIPAFSRRDRTADDPTSASDSAMRKRVRLPAPGTPPASPATRIRTSVSTAMASPLVRDTIIA
jgi:hypothetical protein